MQKNAAPSLPRVLYYLPLQSARLKIHPLLAANISSNTKIPVVSVRIMFLEWEKCKRRGQRNLNGEHRGDTRV